MVDYPEVILRMMTAVLAGCVIGLDRNLHGKPTGIKTMGLVALGASLATMASLDFGLSGPGDDSGALSRTIQGVLTGVGFIGAGVIVHDHASDKIRGLTTAASIWVTAALGVVCGMGAWQIAAVALVIVLLLFLLGRPVEKLIHAKWMSMTSEERDDISIHDE